MVVESLSVTPRQHCRTPTNQPCRTPTTQDGGVTTCVSRLIQDGGGGKVTHVNMQSNVDGDGQDGAQAHDQRDSVLEGDAIAPLLKTNQFTMRKKAANSLTDVALMMANISQLRTLLSGGPEHMEYFYVLIVLVGFSIASQFIFALLIFIIMARESDQEQKEEHIEALQKVEADAHSGKRTKADAAERLRVLKLNREADFHQAKVTSHMNQVTTMLVFAITVVNMFITGFGIKHDKYINTL